MTEQDALQVFQRFKELHPNNGEAFRFTSANVLRWRYHIDQREALSRTYTGKNWARLLPHDFQELINARRVNHWREFPAGTKARYTAIAESFPGIQVYACGSRVRGDYIEANDPEQIRQWRKAAGKSDKQRSDFDFWAPTAAVPLFEVPKGGDRIKHGIAETEKIAIPMAAVWDFSKLPETEHARVVALYKAGNWNELIKIHDAHDLSPYTYCCDISGVKKWYGHAIQTGIIKDGKSTNTTTGGTL